MRVYVAGPYGFTPAGARYLHDVVLPALDAVGAVALDPWVAGDAILGPVLADPIARRREIHRACREVGAANATMIRECDAVLALLDGSDLDSGTCAEVGFAAALGRPVVGLRTDTRWCGDFPEIPINLQVQYFVDASGGSYCTDLDTAIRALCALRIDR